MLQASGPGARRRRTPAALEAETLLHARLRAAGERLLVEPAARLWHINISSARAWLPERLHAGQRFGGARARTWPLTRRTLYAAASPVIPLVRFWRLFPIWQARRAQLPRGTLGAIVVSLMVSALGEALGYLVGSGDSMRRLSRIELHKEHYLSEDERRALAS